MSVESVHFIVDWARLQRMPKDTDLVDHFIVRPQIDDDYDEDGDEDDEGDEGDDESAEDEADEDDEGDEGQAEGARPLGLQDYQHHFQSWNVFIAVSDWLRPLRGELEESIERPFTTLFTAMGILFDDSHGPAGIKHGVQFTDESLIATISPAEVERLGGIARSLDRRVLEREFGRLLAEHPCSRLLNGKVVVGWVDALADALSGVGKDEGILILAPV